MYEIIKCVFITLFGPLILKVIKAQLMEQRRKQTRIFRIQAQVDCQHLKNFFERVVVVRGVTVIWINGNVACVQNFCQPEHLHFCPEKAHKVFTELDSQMLVIEGWVTHSDLWEADWEISVQEFYWELFLEVSINVHPPTQYFHTLNRKSPMKVDMRDVVTTYICLGGLGRKRSSTW